MSLNRYLTIIDQEQTLATAKATSVGIADANKIIATDATGKINETLFPYLFEGTINPSQTVTVYSESFSGFRSRELAVEFSVNNEIKSFNMGIVKNGLSVDDTIFRRIGHLNLTVDAIVTGKLYQIATDPFVQDT